MSKSLHFITKVSGTKDGGHQIRGKDHLSLVSSSSFVATLFLSITGREPTPSEETVLNALLTASLDHGIAPSSGFVPRVVAASGNDIYSSMASTLLALGPRHGGAITGCMNVLQELQNKEDNLEQAAQSLVTKKRAEKERIPGFGHPHYTDQDPRAETLIKIAQQQGLEPTFVQTARMIEIALEKELGRKLVLNIDGAIAAILLTMKIDPLAGNALFGLARIGGSIAHIIEEMQTNTSVRRLSASEIEYQP